MAVQSRSLAAIVGAVTAFSLAACAARTTRETDAAVDVTRVWQERAGRPFSVDDFLSVANIGGVAASPDGRWIALVTKRADRKCNCYHQTVSVLDRPSGKIIASSDLGQPFPAVLPAGLIGARYGVTAQPLWSDDGRFLAFIANAGGFGVLKVFDRGRGAVRRVDTRGGEVFGFAWTGTAGQLVYQTGGPNPAVVQAHREGMETGFLYGPDFLMTDVGLPPPPPHVPVKFFWYADLDDSERKATSTLEVVDVVSGSITPAAGGTLKLLEGRSTSFPHSFVPRKFADSDDGRFRFDFGIDTAKDYRTVTASIVDRQHPGKAALPMDKLCPGSVTEAWWVPARGSFVLACQVRRDLLRFISVDPGTGTGTPWFETLPVDISGTLGRQCDLARDAVICAEEEPSVPPRLMAIDTAGKRTLLFDPNAELRSRHFGRVERLTWKNRRDVETSAYLVYPADYRPDRRYPLVLVQYIASGFLRGGTGNENPVFPYAEAGLFVLAVNHPDPPPVEIPDDATPNERLKAHIGGTRYDEGVQDSLDRITDHLVKRGLVDPERVAYTGMSRGSMQIDFALANGRRLAAAISSTCCFGPDSWTVHAVDWLLSPIYTEFLGSTFSNPATDPDFDEHYRESWSKIAAIMHVDTIHTAYLANAAQSEIHMPRGFWARMRAAHKPMELFIHAGEYHAKTQPRQLGVIYERNIDWLRFWLLNSEDPAPAKAEQYRRWRALREEWRQSDPQAQRVLDAAVRRQQGS